MDTMVRLKEDTMLKLRLKKIHNGSRSYDEVIKGLLNER